MPLYGQVYAQDAKQSMIHTLRLQNYKCFEDQSLTFKALTLLSGLNGTGKSSVIQSLLLLRQSYQQGLLQTTGLALNGDLVHIGTAKDALFEAAKEDTIGFDLALGDGMSKGMWHFSYDEKADVLGLSQAKPMSFNAIYKSSLFERNFHYLMYNGISRHL